MRKNGILLPVFSLPSPYGTGCFSHEARLFIDFLEKAGCSCWQILPMNATGRDNCPYQPISCFAGDPLLIDPAQLEEEGLLSEADTAALEAAAGSTAYGDRRIDYGRLVPAKMRLLRTAFENSLLREELTQSQDIPGWLSDYALFAALTGFFGTSDWNSWPEDIRLREAGAVERYSKLLDQEIRFRIWMELVFQKQWSGIRDHARAKGIEIIGDIPIYTAYESTDCWTNPEIFQLNDERRPEAVSGVPPDQFSPDGQKWNTPLYDWELLKEQGYSWWIDRIERTFELYDTVRIDHTRGFESYFSIPAEDETAARGHWEPGPGTDFFRAVEKELGSCSFIAEDLGYLTPEVYEMIREADLPGMKVLQFAFDSDDSNPHLPGNYTERCAAYTGTHDNDTSKGWYRSIDDGRRKYLLDYGKRYLPWDKIDSCDGGLPLPDDFTRMVYNVRDLHSDCIPEEDDAVALMAALVLGSPAERAVIPIQDWLSLDSESRINTPGTVTNNWEWRMLRHEFSDELAERIRSVTEFFR